MVGSGHLAAFLAAAVLLIAIPGPSVLFVLGRTLAHGRRTGLYSVAGNTLGSLSAAIAVALGLGAVMQTSAVAFAVVKYAGAAYLLYLGVKTLRRRDEINMDVHVPGAAGVRSALEGYAVGVTNPKAILFFAAVLPQFVDPDGGAVPLQLLLFSVLFGALAFVMDGAWALGAAAARSWFGRSPRRLRWLSRVGGASMIGLGLTAAATGRAD